MKKIFALLLTLTLAGNIITAAPVLAEGSFKDNDNIGGFIRALDIVDEKYLENPNSTMSRGEMIELVVDFMDLETMAEAYSGRIQFYDIDENDEYCKDICYAATQGFCYGSDDGMIHAYENATVKQAVITFVNALGHRSMAMTMGSEEGYLEIAEKTGISDGLRRSLYKELTRELAVKLMYNVLMSKVYDINSLYETNGEVHPGFGLKKDTNYLYERFEIYEIEGTVTSTPTAYIEDGVTKKGRIAIDSEVYTNPNSYGANLLGRNVIAYIKDGKGGVNETVYIGEARDVKTLTAFSSDLSTYDRTARTYKYYPHDAKKIETLKLTEATEFIYNGRPVDTLSADVVNPADGKFVFIDNDDNDLYDYVIIESYTTMVTETVDTGNMIIFDSVSGKKLSYGSYDDNIYIFDADGNALEIEDINGGNVLTVIEGGDALKLYVSGESMYDKVQACNTDEGDVFLKMTDGIEYLVNKYFTQNFPNGQKVGQNGDFYLDVFGRITYVKNSMYNNLGYVLKITPTDEDEAPTQIKILNIYGKLETLKLSEKVRIDGVKCDNYGRAELQLSGVTRDDGGNVTVTGLKNNIIIYELNDKNEIKSIETAYDFNNTTGALEKELSNGQKLNKNDGIHMSYQIKDLTYNGLRSFDGKGLMNSNAKVFVVPVNSAGKINLANSEVFDVQGTGYFKKWSKYSGKQYKINKDNEGADVVVVFENVENSTMPDIANVMCVSKVTEFLSDDDEIVKQFTGYVLGKEETYVTRSNGMGDGIEKGDIIKFVIDSKQRIGAITKVYDVSAGQMLEATNSFANTFRVLIRPVYKVRGNAVITAEKDELASVVNENDYEGFFIDSSIPIYKIDTDIRKGDISEITTYEQNPNAYSKLFLYTSSGNVRMAVIYD